MAAPQREPDAYGDEMRNSALAVFALGVFLFFGVLKLRNYLAWHDLAGEHPEMSWLFMIAPGICFLLALLNWRAYRKHIDYERRKHMLK